MQDNIPYSFLLGHVPVIPKPAEAEPLFRDRYDLLEVVGKGTFSTVYKARDAQNGTIVAVKQFRQSGLSPQMRAAGHQCFRREANLLAHLRHPQIPVLYDSALEGYPWYLTISYIPGQNLAQFIRQFPQQIVPLNVAAGIVLKLCDVLGYLHAHQPPIKFRDLNPENILLTQNGQVFLIDFGAARVFIEGEPDPTPLCVQGYSPREQYANKWGQGASVLASDVYSLGAILHQMLSGTDPRFAQARFQFSPLSPFHVPPTLVALVAQMLSEQQDRPTIQQVSMVIAPFVR